jgi:hypothetical protein
MGTAIVGAWPNDQAGKAEARKRLYRGCSIRRVVRGAKLFRELLAVDNLEPLFPLSADALVWRLSGDLPLALRVHIVLRASGVDATGNAW